MVNVRNAASPNVSRGSPGKRKRSDGDDDGGNEAASSRRRYDTSPNRRRAPSAGPHVRFPRSLIMGPHQSDPHRRSLSPTRSALHKRDDPNDGPSAQLHAEHDASQDHAAAPRLLPSNRTPGPTQQRSPHGCESQRQANTADPLDNRNKRGSNSARKSSTTKSSLSVGDNEDDPLTRHDSTLGNKGAVSTSLQLNDEEICRKMNDLRSAATELAKTCPPLPSKHKVYMLDHFLVRENEQLIRHIGCLAMGGPTGEQGWVTLLSDTTCRQALVLGIIGRALKENVFNELYFGGSDRLVESLSKMEQEQTHLDGFFRTRERATAIRKYKPKQSDGPIFRKAVVRVTLQLERLLLPLWQQGDVGSQHTWAAACNRQKLAAIVSTASHLSRTLRASADVVYYWPPTFKDEEFEPSRMECFNVKAMITESPYDKKEVNGFERPVLRDGHQNEDEAIVRVVCFPGLVAYRQHGGALAEQELEDEESERRTREGREKLPPDVQRHRRMIASREKTLTGDEGFRTRVISKSIVLLQWGKQRLLTKEAGTSRHVDAMKGKGAGMKKYEDDYVGFKELYDLYQEAINPELSRGPGIVGTIGGWFSRSPSASAEPASRKAVIVRTGSNVPAGAKGKR